MVKVGEEDLRIRGRFHGHGGDHATYAHCTQYREDLPVALGRGFGDAPSSPSTSIPLGHLRRDAALIQKNKPFRSDGAQPFYKGFPSLTVRFRVAFCVVERLVSAGSQARPRSSRDAACSHGCRSEPSVRLQLAQVEIRLALEQSSNHLPSTRTFGPGRYSFRFIEPLRFRALEIFHAHERLTPNQSDNSARLPLPRS